MGGSQLDGISTLYQETAAEEERGLDDSRRQFFDKRSGKADDFTFQNLTNVYSVTDVVRV